MHDLIPVFPDRDHGYVKEILKKASACPVCGASNAKLNGVAEAKMKPRYAILCTGCNNIGPFGKTLHHALKNWNDSIPRKRFAFLRQWFGSQEMTKILPTNAEVIYAEWVTREGGVCALAFTDKKGRPFLAVCALNRMGKANGLPCWMHQAAFVSEIVIGFRRETPILICVSARVTKLGLELVIRTPREIPGTTGYECRSMSAWGTEPPNLGFIVAPTGGHWPGNPLPWELPEE